MNKKLRRIAFVAGMTLFGSTALIAPRPAHAGIATSADVIAAKIEEIAKQYANKADILQNVGDWITQAYNGLSNQVLSQSGQETQNSTAQMKNANNIADAQTQMEYQNHVADATHKAIVESTSGSNNCAAITGKMNGAQLINQVRAVRAAMAAQASAVSSGFDINNPNRSMSSLDIQNAYHSQHCANDATELDVNMGICPSVTAPNNSDNVVVDNNGQSHVMIPDDQNANVFLNNPSLTPQQAESGQRFTMLVADSHPSGQVLPRLTGSTADRQAQMYEWDRQRAIRSLAKSVISQMIAESIVPNPNSSDQQTLRAWAENRAKTIAGYVPNSAGLYFPNGVSDFAFNELMARGYANDLNQDIIGSSQNSSASLKDIRQILQFQTMIMWKMYMQGRDQNMLLAGIQSTLSDQEERNNAHTSNAGH